MFRLTELQANGRTVLKLEGRITGALVKELDAAWRRAADAPGHAAIRVDLSDVWLVDADGQALLARMHRGGVEFVTRGCEMRELVREISEAS